MFFNVKFSIFSPGIEKLSLNFPSSWFNDKKFRNNRLAPVLIKEITRRFNRRDIWQAVYTAGVIVSTPVSKAVYYHRSLNP